MSQSFNCGEDLWSSESEDSSSVECEVPNASECEEASHMPEYLKSLVNELQDILKTEDAAKSSSQKDSSSLEINERKEDIIKEYGFNTKPPISNIKEVKLLPLKNWRNRVEVIKSEKFPKLKRKYFDELNDIINKWRHQEQGIVLNPIKKESSLSYFFSDIMLAISAELGKTDLKPLLLLKALYYFFSNFETLFAKNATLKTKCIVSLKKFVTNSLKCTASKYLLKDIATDILSELGCVSLTSTAVKLFTCNFRYLQDSHEDLYGTTVAWLSNVTPETGANLVHCEAEFSDTLALRALNSPKILRRLILVCESSVCCSSSQLENLSLTERINMLNQSDGISQMEIDDVPTQKEDVSLVRRKPFYDRNLVNNFNDLIRHETIYTPVFYFKYEPRISKPFNFSNLILNEMKMRLEKHAAKEYPNQFVKIKTQDAFVKSKDLQEDTDSPKSFFVTEHKESYISDSNFWNSWDIFSDFETRVDSQLAYFGHISSLENLTFDIYSREKANTYQVSVRPSDMDPMNVKASPNVFDHFKMPDSYTVFQKTSQEKPPRKRKLSPSA